ncbi:hypothetical protein V6N12_017637 [Hibiscus sabdariffa]|uniref:F-box domain-containing protein n=1 Tax=Hibiscus sabdariffa TaxID=183260 RepID=A0ABR2CG50_9ROSI
MDSSKCTQDALIGIVSRLPAASLMRFQAVAKCFASLVHDRHFVKLHLQKRSKYIMLRTLMLGQQGSHFLLLPLSKVQGEDPPMKEV